MTQKMLMDGKCPDTITDEEHNIIGY